MPNFVTISYKNLNLKTTFMAATTYRSPKSMILTNEQLLRDKRAYVKFQIDIS